MSKSAQQVLAAILGGPPQKRGSIGSQAECAKTEVLLKKSVLDDASFGWRAVAALRMLRGNIYVVVRRDMDVFVAIIFQGVEGAISDVFMNALDREVLPPTA